MRIAKINKLSKQKHTPSIWKTVKLESHISVIGLWSIASYSGSVRLPRLASHGWEAFPGSLSSLDPSEADIAEDLSFLLFQRLPPIG